MHQNYVLSKRVLENLRKHLSEFKKGGKKQLLDALLLPAAEMKQVEELFERYEQQLLDLVQCAAVDDDRGDTLPFVTIGSEVDLQDHQNKKFRCVQITVPGQNGTSCKKPRATCLSPMGRALFLRSPGDEIEVEAPSGKLHYTVQSITLLDD